MEDPRETERRAQMRREATRAAIAGMIAARMERERRAPTRRAGARRELLGTVSTIAIGAAQARWW